MMFTCAINGMYAISITVTIINIVFVKFVFNAVCLVVEFFVRNFTLINIAILNQTPSMIITPSHTVKTKKTKLHEAMRSIRPRQMK